jgi:hypothetical protein
MELLGLRNAWLSPTGEVVTDAPHFYPGSGGWHENLAGCILRDLLALRTDYEAHELARRDTPFAYTYEYLESLGWVRLCGWGTAVLKWVIPCGTKLTRAQGLVIDAWCDANGLEVVKALDACRCGHCPPPA